MNNKTHGISTELSICLITFDQIELDIDTNKIKLNIIIIKNFIEAIYLIIMKIK